MINMIDLVQAEQAIHEAEKVLAKPYADGSDKFKQSASIDTLEKTTK